MSSSRRPSVHPTTSEGLTAFLDLSPDAVVVVDRDGRIAHANHEAEVLFGYVVDDLVGELVEALVPDDQQTLHEVQRVGFTAAPTQRPMGAGRNLHARHADGTRIPVDISLAPIETDEGPLVAAVVRDVRDRRDAYAALEEANARLQATNDQLEAVNAHQERFVSMASHELRTPLTTITGFVEMLQLRWRELDDERRAQYLQTIRRSVERQTALLDDLLDVSRIRVGRLDLAPAPRDLTRLVDDALLAADLATPEVTVSLGRDTTVLADEGRLVQVLVNLLTNARRYGRPPVTVTAERDGDMVEVRVRDHGPGVPADFEASLFGMFAQASIGDRRTAGGTGLGLYIVQQLVAAHHGTVTHRRPADGGAEFVVRLPAA